MKKKSLVGWMVKNWCLEWDVRKFWDEHTPVYKRKPKDDYIVKVCITIEEIK